MNKLPPSYVMHSRCHIIFFSLFSENKLKKLSLRSFYKRIHERHQTHSNQASTTPSATLESNQEKLPDPFCRSCWQYQLPTALSPEGLWLELSFLCGFKYKLSAKVCHFLNKLIRWFHMWPKNIPWFWLVGWKTPALFWTYKENLDASRW